MAAQKKLSFQDKLNIINDNDKGIKQVNVTKKQGVLQPTVAILLRKRKQIEDAASPNAINQQQID